MPNDHFLGIWIRKWWEVKYELLKKAEYTRRCDLSGIKFISWKNYCLQVKLNNLIMDRPPGYSETYFLTY